MLAVNAIAPPEEIPVPVIAIGSATVIVPEILRTAPLLTIVPDIHDPEAVQEVPVPVPKAVLLLIAKVPAEIVVLPV